MEELEIEFKNLIDYPVYDRLRNTYFKEAAVITQTNFYIDNTHEEIAAARIALRIRDTGDSLMMTLKVPQEVGIMEYYGKINPTMLDDEHINQHEFPDNIRQQLESRGIDVDSLYIVGALSTERREIPYDGGLLVLDASHYLDTEDFELEYEVSDYESGLEKFETFLSQQGIQSKKPLNKIQRFYARHKALTSKSLS
ncbi:CYTH domain-containing protein [Macrococcus brunensis]|uniref:CYTH domain-containing protein n=1 Tax=Macrococcus brunensis TaxID=198483 RepID=UPI001EF109B0|nr:CYTH domain-containing protein [Macrococcus brunensis]ULG72652.1 CYTH domain-containing protein [Macrococcus brunensis]